MKQHLFRRILAAFMAVAMLAAAACVPAFAREIKGTKKVLVNYVVSDNDKSIDFVYSDAFFNQGGYKYSQDLAKISNGLAVAAGGSQRARKSGKMRDQNQNFVQFADACEFEKFQSSEYMKNVRCATASASTAQARRSTMTRARPHSSPSQSAASAIRTNGRTTATSAPAETTPALPNPPKRVSLS